MNLLDKTKCKVLHLGQGNPQCQYRVVDKGLRATLQRTWGTDRQKIRYEPAMSQLRKSAERGYI